MSKSGNYTNLCTGSHVTAHGQNTDFRKSEKLLLSEKSVRNTIDITVSANFPVAVFIRHIT
ncbi:hypothetical protein FOV95_24085 [Escherichia coli]|nr:hypothetical protein FOV95_24085 [Escherichia coli]